MTREDAERRASVLNAQESADRWFVRRGPNGWDVVKVALPAAMRLHPVRESAEERPTPGNAPPAMHRFYDGFQV